jgi:hypothetical protein
MTLERVSSLLLRAVLEMLNLIGILFLLIMILLLRYKNTKKKYLPQKITSKVSEFRTILVISPHVIVEDAFCKP